MMNTTEHAVNMRTRAQIRKVVLGVLIDLDEDINNATTMEIVERRLGEVTKPIETDDSFTVAKPCGAHCLPVAPDHTHCKNGAEIIWHPGHERERAWRALAEGGAPYIHGRDNPWPWDNRKPPRPQAIPMFHGRGTITVTPAEPTEMTATAVTARISV